MPLKKIYTLRMLRQLDKESLNGIRGTYYSPNVTKIGNIPQIDKSIKVEELKATDFGKMLQALGYLKASVYVKPTQTSKTTDVNEVEDFLDKLNNFDNSQTSKGNGSNDVSTELSKQEKEIEEKKKKLLELEKKLEEKKEELDNRENQLRQKEEILNRKMSSVTSQLKENASLLGGLEVPQQVLGIKLRQSEQTRLLSKDGERSRLIKEAAIEICNKWLQINQKLRETTKGHTTEKFVYKFVQDFVKSNFPYCGEAVYNLVLYDLKKRREEMNGTTAND